MEKDCVFLVDERVENCFIKKLDNYGRIRCPYKLRGESCEICGDYFPNDLKKN